MMSRLKEGGLIFSRDIRGTRIESMDWPGIKVTRLVFNSRLLYK